MTFKYKLIRSGYGTIVHYRTASRVTNNYKSRSHHNVIMSAGVEARFLTM